MLTGFSDHPSRLRVIHFVSIRSPGVGSTLEWAGLVGLVMAKIPIVFYVKRAGEPHPAKLFRFFWRCDIFQPRRLNSGAEEALSHTCQEKLLQPDIHLQTPPEDKRSFSAAPEDRNNCTGGRRGTLKWLLAQSFTLLILFSISFIFYVISKQLFSQRVREEEFLFT